MARIESQAVAGYYPTPPRLVAHIAALLSVPDPEESYALLDPCAGDGAAVLELARALFGSPERAVLFAVELEAGRHRALVKAQGRNEWQADRQCLRGDAFCVEFAGEGVQCLFLNPPYDHDREHGRLEERFLRRFAPALQTNGVLVLLVPFYALEASADTLARGFNRLHCYRFPEPEWATFRQVVLVGCRHAPLHEPDPVLAAQVRAWAQDASAIPVLPEGGPPVLSLPGRNRWSLAPLQTWRMLSVDLQSLCAAARPWHATNRAGAPVPLPGILPEPEGDLLARSYPVAMPPRAAHIAAGIAAGVFNGARLEPDDRASGLPPVLVKGTFDREFRTVEERKDKHGEVRGVVQVQQPRLVVTALDLKARRYHTLRMSTEVTGAQALSEMTTADLLDRYGRGLLGTLREHCPVLHDPADAAQAWALPSLARPLFRAQEAAVRAAVTLLGGPEARPRERRGKAALVLGEIGSGKSSVALAVAETIRARRVLVLCPPHLLDSWREQAHAVVPHRRVVVLEDVQDVQALAELDEQDPVVAVLSRETAKLGHALAPVTGPSCPRCGAGLPAGVDFARRRTRCEARAVAPANRAARLAEDLALVLLPGFAAEPRAEQLLRGRALARAARVFASRPGTEARREAARRDPRLVRVVQRVGRVLEDKAEVWETGGKLAGVLAALLLVVGNDALTASVARGLYEASREDPRPYGKGDRLRHHARDLLLLAVPGCTAQREAAKALRAVPVDSPGYGGTSHAEAWRQWDSKVAGLAGALAGSTDEGTAEGTRALEHDPWHEVQVRAGRVCRGRWTARDPGLLLEALALLYELGQWTTGPACEEPLFQAVPEPRRVPLATYLARRHPHLFDLVVLDESHEYGTDGSAQERAAHRLTALGLPTLLLTGSVMNGYAESLFANLWAISPAFRAEFRREDRAAFVTRYGYRKRLVEERDAKTGEVLAYGTVTDRVERRERDLGNAPGVLPLLVLRHLLPLAVTLQKADLAQDLPPCRHLVARVDPGEALRARHEVLARKLLERVRRDQFGPLAGKLWGQLAELPSHLDRATTDTGNVEGGAYEVRYPEAAGGELVARAEPFPAGGLLPKERWLLETVAAELSEGRRCMVFAWHSTVLPRLARLLAQHLGEPVPVLDANKVPAAKRQAWIEREVVGKGRRVLVVNPVCVQTGLNCLTWFSTEVWMQNPACNPVVFRQAVGRVDRIGQTLETRIYFPVYAGTTQEALHKLLLRKVAVSQATDGIDAEAALAAAGAGEDVGLGGLAVGRQLYEMLGRAI